MLRLSYSERHPIPLPPGHRFPIEKYRLVREQLEYLGLIQSGQLFAPEFIDDEVICLTHSPVWWSRAKVGALDDKEYRRIGFPNCTELVERSISSASGTLQSALHALEDGAGMNLAGGTHHAFFDRGEGFCLLNDIAIAANYLLDRRLVQKVLIVDLDVHQGNGTASLFRSDPRVFTFSIHCGDNYPLAKEQSDLDVVLKAGTTDEEYMAALKAHIPRLYEVLQPDIVFYQAGVDVLGTDLLGKLALTREGCRARDHLVISQAWQHRLPLVLVMGGGYSHSLATIVNAHSVSYQIVLDFYEKIRF